MELLRPTSLSERVLVAVAFEALTLDEIALRTGDTRPSVAGSVSALNGTGWVRCAGRCSRGRIWCATAKGLERMRRHEADGMGPDELARLRLP